MSQAQELLAAPSAVTALSGAEASGAASHSSDDNGMHSFGGQVSPRAARSQISTAVSFEGARAAGSAALPSRSLEEESALSAAEGDVDYSHSAEANHAAAGSVRPIRNGRLLRPSNSLMSTAVQPASPQLQQPVSPKLNRANSVVSHTAHTGGRQHAGRAGTPASAYVPGQGFLLPSRARQQSPAQPSAVDQVEQQTAAAGAVEQHRPGFVQLPPAWQHMPPAFAGLPVVTGQAAGQETAILQSPQHQQHLNALHTLEVRDSFDGHHRSSDNGGGRRRGNLGYEGGLCFAGYQAAEAVMNGSAANGAAGSHRPASPAALQPGTVLLQPNMQLFQNALAALPTAVAGGLLQGLLGQTGMGPTPVLSQGFAPPATTAAPGAAGTAAAAAAGGTGAAGHAAGVHDVFARQSPVEAASGSVGMSTDLLQQLQVQMTPALLAVLQGQATSDGHGHSQHVPGLPYTPQQLQQALSLLLAGLASQAGQYGIVLHGIGGSPAAAVQQQLHVPAGAAGMRPPPAPVQAKSCDSSIAGAPASKLRESARPAAVGGAAAASSAAPSSSQPRDLSPMAAPAAAVHANSQGIAAQAGTQQLVPQQVPHGSAVGQQLPSMWLQQQHWRSPSPSPAPMGLAAARTSAAGEGHGSLIIGGLGSGYLQSQQGVDAAGAISSAGGASRAGGALTSEEGEADAPDVLAADAAVDDADQQGSIDGAGEAEDGSQLAGDGIQHGATSPSRRQQQHAHGAAAEAAAEQQQLHAGEHVNPATSVHATMMSDGNESGSESEADSGQANAHSGGTSRGAIAGEQHPGPVAEVVSQPCGASHSASPQPSASTPAVAIATGPASRSVLVGSGGVGCSRDVVAAVEPSAGPPGHGTAAVEQQHRSQQPSARRQHGNEHEGSAGQGRQEHQQHRDSSLAMATAGPAGTHSVTVSTNSGTVDMSIHNNSQRSGAGNQGEAPAVGGWLADDEEMQDAGNSRDGEARGEPPGTYETAESGREADNGYQAHHQHVQQHRQPMHPHQQRQQHVSAGSPVPGHSAAGHGAAAAAPHGGHADAAGIALGMELEQRRRREQRQAVRFATASTPGDGCVGSPSLQGAYSSSDVGIPGVSAAGYTGAVPHRQSSAAGNLAADEAVAAVYGSDHGVSVADEVDAGSMLLPGAAEGLQDNLPGSLLLGGVPSGADRQPQPATAEHVEHVSLHAAFSVTSQLQPVGQPAAAAVLQHPAQLGHQHRHRPQQRGGLRDGCNMLTASHAQASEHGLALLAADAVPQVTEIHGQFPDHSVPATAAAAQMAAAAAGHAQPQPDAHPQVTEMHGMLGASAGTAAGALLAAAAANGQLQNQAYSPGAAAAAAGLGATGSTLGDGGLPPLPHMHSIRVNHSHHQRPQFAAPGSSRTGPAASNGQIAGQGMGLNFASPPPAAHPYGGQWVGNLQMHGHKAASLDAPQPAAHSRVRHSPPAVNFNPTAQGTGMVNGTSQTMPLAVTPAMLAAAQGAVSPVAVDGATAGSQLHRQEQQPCPGSPSHAQGNSQLGQQDGSRGSPPAGMGRVGSVPPQDHSGTAAGEGEAGVVEQEPHRSRHSLSEDAGSHHQAADDLHQRQQHVEQEADGPSHAAGLSRQQGDSRSAVTSPAQQQSRHVNGFISAAAVAAADGDRCQQSWQRQPQQHWQQQQGAGTEGAGQVGGRAASMPFSLGQPEGSVAAGISSKIYGSVSAGFASGSKAEGSPSYGAGLDGCSCGNAMVSGADGHVNHRQQQQQEDNEQDNQQQAQSHSTRRRRRPREGPAGAAAAAAGALQEGEGSHGSRSQEVRSCKRQRASCEAASAQQPPRVTSSMQTTEA